jgi:hypothetical protein
MANVDRAIGLRPLRHLGGGEVRMSAYTIASGYDTALGAGDPVVMTGTGRNIARAAASDVGVIGVFYGVKYTNQQGEKKWSARWPANQVATEIEAMVYDDPNISYRVQFDTLAEGDVGALADFVITDANAVTGLSTIKCTSTGAAGSGKPCRIIGLIDEVHNAYGAHADAEVLLMAHVLRGIADSAGGNL